MTGLFISKHLGIDKCAIGEDFVKLAIMYHELREYTCKIELDTYRRTIFSFSEGFALSFPLFPAIRISAPRAVSACSTLPTL